MSLDAVAPGRFDIARVIQETFGVLRRNLVTFGVLSFLLAGIPTAIVGALQASQFRNRADDIATGQLFLSAGYWQGASLSGLAMLISTAILQGTLIYATVQDLNGARPSIPDCLATGLRNFLQLFVVGLLFALAVGFGMVLLVVPGIMIACAWCVAGPALVADRTGIFGAFRRAADLTRGNRWQIFGLAVLTWVVLLVISMVFAVFTGAAAMTLGDPTRAIAAAASPVAIIVSLLRATIGAVLTSTLISVIYVELRRSQEGAGPEWLRDVFS